MSPAFSYFYSNRHVLKAWPHKIEVTTSDRSSRHEWKKLGKKLANQMYLCHITQLITSSFHCSAPHFTFVPAPQIAFELWEKMPSKNNTLMDQVWRLPRELKRRSSRKDKWTVKCNGSSNKYSINLNWAFHSVAVSSWQSQEEGEDWSKHVWSKEVCVHVCARARAGISSHTRLPSQNKYISWPGV